MLMGLGCMLALDLEFAPAALSAPPTSSASSTAPLPRAPAVDGSAPLAARVVIPAPARVPTIVARFESTAKEPSDQAAIRALATAMIEDHDVTIVLEGHSDSRGGEDYNHTISLERANWVKARLVELGVSADRIETEGLGATRPLRSDGVDPSVNRRVEVRWLGSAVREAIPPRVAVKSPAPPAPKETPPRDASSPARPQPITDAGDVTSDAGAITAPDSELERPPPLPPPGETAN